MDKKCYICDLDMSPYEYCNSIYEIISEKERPLTYKAIAEMDAVLIEKRYYCSGEHIEGDSYKALMEVQYIKSKGYFHVLSKSKDDQVKNNDKFSVLSM